LSPTPSPIKANRASQHRPASAADSTNATEERSPSPTATNVSTTSTLTESALASHNADDSPPTRRNRRTVPHLATPSAPHRDAQGQPSVSHAVPNVTRRAGPSNLPATHSPMVTMSSTFTLSSSAVPRGTISSMVGSPLSSDIEDLLRAVGKEGDDSRKALHQIFQFTGRALWVDSVMEQLNLAEGTAKALVGLMLNIA
jgi:hypothetical protein